ncbi:hypothetical protein DCAR_0209224 [Daucus carota subsp. sativus]|uniref:Reverse transcriptase domain-containing protein n=1 Tax=Daucus carota subsp. sativus TaxID=79200 RepID=A0AAF1AP57_DAUCS|nr:hypothetical protein DCAR_0209224 [Daucus carota subsp. sativus]
MNPDKAPGPDGMTPAFFQKHWGIVGRDVVKLTRHFFTTGELSPGLNTTNLVLIPKKKNPTLVSELRPIALCNVVMKIITKVMANRLKEVLNVVVSDTQSAFIPGRLISDNIMISYEIMHYLKRKKVGKDGFMALKLDMSKAYDRIEWSFLKSILLKMGFSKWWVHLVLQCVTTVKYSIVHGEYEMGPIIPTRGIRQGDPLSPYLFIICAEGLSSLIRRYERQNWIHGIKVCRSAPVVSHMLFADDSYFYVKADTTEASKVIELLNIYEKASGQKINNDKSSVFFSSNVIQYNRQDICQVLQMGEADEHCKYLGLPNIIGRNKTAILGFLKEKVHTRIRSWDGKFIARSGKEILVKSVVQALPVYAMNVFLLPMEINRDIEKRLTRFWWNSKQASGSQINWMSWERLEKHKSVGGMGFRNFRDFNLAMLGKQGWRFLTNPDSLVSRLYKARYFADGDFLNSSIGHNPSFIWRSIVEAKQILRDGVRWRVGSGKDINIVGQPWLIDKQNPFITTMTPAIDGGKVSALFCTDRKEWDMDVIKDVFNRRDQKCILDIKLDAASNEDVLFWNLERSGEYSVKSAYNMLQRQKGAWGAEDNFNVWQALWRLKVPPKALNLVWRALSHCLPTMTQLQLKHVPVQVWCPVCKEEPETILHSLVTCTFAWQCWLALRVNISWDQNMDFSSWMNIVLSTGTSKQRAEAVMLCWAIWRARNDLIWNQKFSTVNKVVAAAKQNLTQWILAQSRSSHTLLQPQVKGDGGTIWVKPQPNTVKVSVDAAIFEDKEEVGFGLVARDSEGSLIQAKAVSHTELLDPVLAEAMAVKEALSWIDEMQWPATTLESDCQIVVQAIRSVTPMRSRFGGIISECRILMQHLNNVELFFVKRSANMVAHQLARESYFLSDRSFDRCSIPRSVKDCIEADLLS